MSGSRHQLSRCWGEKHHNIELKHFSETYFETVVTVRAYGDELQYDGKHPKGGWRSSGDEPTDRTGRQRHRIDGTRSVGQQNGVSAVVHGLRHRSGQCVALSVSVLSQRWRRLSRAVRTDAVPVRHSAVLHGIESGPVYEPGMCVGVANGAAAERWGYSGCTHQSHRRVCEVHFDFHFQALAMR